MQLKDLGIKVITVVALTTLLAACSGKKEVTPDTSVDTTTDSSDSGPGRVDTPEVDQDVLAGPADGSYDQMVAFAGGDRVHFEFDSHDLSTAAQAVLSKQAEWLNKYSSVSITVEGHCDERGTREYNIALGARRSNAVKEYLVSMGVSGYRVKATTKGKEVPVDPRSNEDAWAKNRRAEMATN